MLTDKRGFTLVELIVVVVIIGITASLIGLSGASVNSARTRQCAQSTDILISKCRVESLSRAGEIKLTLAMDGGDMTAVLSENGAEKERESFAGRGLAVSYTLNLGGTESVADIAAHPLTLSFDRSTGAQKPQPDGSYCTKIVFSGSRAYTITLVPSTGSHKLA